MKFLVLGALKGRLLLSTAEVLKREVNILSLFEAMGIGYIAFRKALHQNTAQNENIVQ